MFGYIRPYAPELKIKEHEAFKGLYCGLCYQLGVSFKSWVRLTLNYDFVFLAMLYYSNNDQMPILNKKRCAVNPLSKVVMCESDEGLVYAADIAMIMMYYKIADNILDSRSLKKTSWKVADQIVKSDWIKAANRRPKENQVIKEMMTKQASIEKTKSTSIDAACEPTAWALSQLMYDMSGDENQARLGYLMGRFVYLCDAVEDLEEDLKTNNYNPYIAKYLEINRDKKDINRAISHGKRSLYMTIGEIGRLNNQLNFKYFSPIINNVIELGMLNSVKEILTKKGGELDESL